jgi:hypothetical protein
MEPFKVTNKPSDHLELSDELSILSLYDKSNPDTNLFNLVDDEVIKLSGSKILVYKYLSNQEYDDVYMEANEKVIAKEPIAIFGKYDPRPLEENLSQFGVEVQNDQVFIFNKNYVERKLGRAIIAGDILKPDFQNMKYEVFQVQEDSFEGYSVYHLLVYAKLLRDTEDIHNSNIKVEDPVGGILE